LEAPLVEPYTVLKVLLAKSPLVSHMMPQLPLTPLKVSPVPTNVYLLTLSVNYVSKVFLHMPPVPLMML
jgi:hypothetical protein